MKTAEKASVFNFEAVYSKYKTFIQNYNSLMVLNKQLFLKIFVELVNQGFLRSEGETSDILNVNTKICLGFREKELKSMIIESKDKLGLTHNLMNWATSSF